MRAKLSVLERDEIDAIHGATLDILSEIGVGVRESRARALLLEAGAQPGTDADRVRIPEGLLMEAVRGVPKEWTWHARDPARSFRVGGGERTRLGPGSSCTMIVDYATGGPRSPTPADGDALVRLLDALELVDIAYTPVSFGAADDTPRLRETGTLVRDLTHTSKPLVGPSFDGTMAKDGLEVAKVLAGGEETLRKRPMLAGYCDPIAPLVHDRMMTETVIEYARMGQPVFLMCLDLAGASSPASLAGTLVQQNAEILSGVLIAYLVNRRVPLVYGCVSGTMDMRAGSAAVGGPEFGLLSAASVQLSHHYGLPCSAGGQSDSPIHDAQAAFEKGTTLLASMLAGADFVDLFFGSYAGFNATSPEQVVIDHELAGYAHRYARGIRVDPEALSVERIRAVGPGGSYLRDPKSLRDTMARMATEWYLPGLFDRRVPDAASLATRPSLLESAHREAERVLREHEPTPLDPDVLREMNEVLVRIRREEAAGRSRRLGKPKS